MKIHPFATTAWACCLCLMTGVIAAAQDEAQPAAANAAADTAAGQPTVATEPAAAAPHDLPTLAQRMAEAIEQLSAPSADESRRVAQQLEALAQQSNELASKLPDSAAKLQAHLLQLQAYNALADRAARRHEQTEAESRVIQLRAAAAQVRGMDAPGAAALADFWQLQADLFEINGSSDVLDGRQRRAIGRLEQFLSQAGAGAQKEADARADTNIEATDDGVKGADPDAVFTRDMVRQVELALLRLCDQRGHSVRTTQLVRSLRRGAGDGSGDAAMMQLLDERYGYTDILGQQFQANLKLSNGSVWKSENQRGRVVLIHFLADWSPASLRAWEQVKTSSAALKVRGVTTLSVRVAEGAGAGDEAQPPRAAGDGAWPVYQEGPGQVSLSRMFAVASLPRFVVIDQRGRVSAIGGSMAILEHVESLLSSPPASNAASNAAQDVTRERQPDAANTDR